MTIAFTTLAKESENVVGANILTPLCTAACVSTSLSLLSHHSCCTVWQPQHHTDRHVCTCTHLSTFPLSLSSLSPFMLYSVATPTPHRQTCLYMYPPFNLPSLSLFSLTIHAVQCGNHNTMQTDMSVHVPTFQPSLSLSLSLSLSPFMLYSVATPTPRRQTCLYMYPPFNLPSLSLTIHAVQCGNPNTTQTDMSVHVPTFQPSLSLSLLSHHSCWTVWRPQHHTDRHVCTCTHLSAFPLSLTLSLFVFDKV